ncbi:serine/threonine kinase-like domain-containing protein STKLD1 isoform X1 [Vidua chalybeata]|uniref:serine/threonine kinase-like domain-containing protein STKLD1 isoform X1 n=2 Tax=Vidua chalybeata TaxID=81927 RepID=UPI0023A7CA63|nr:serine/threonine kinase-like domain-containing protein STKLD1 isoform X1 [Vidua chalybeata]
MEKYEVLQQLQPGALGTMLVAQLKTDRGAQKKYAIKQVECIDQHQANVALKEAMDLLKLCHSNICTYKELFLTWNKEVSSLFLCLVMQHSGQGDLSALIKEKRQKSEKITGMVVQKFLGQMVDALFYIHKRNIWHRNLKPSNILVTGEPSFMLSDFSTETLMKDDLKWKIRVEEESKSWMAPETFEFSFTEKSDIWSLGCVLLDMMSCFVLNAEEINSLLQDIRGDSSCLEGVLALMQDGESSYLPFFPLLLMMLQTEPSLRPTARDLVTVPFVGKCLTFAGGTSIKLKKSLPPTMTDVLFQGGVESVLEFMQASWDIEEVQAKGIQHLASFVKDKSAFPHLLTCTEVITLAMKIHTDSLDLQVEGCTLLLEILSQALEQGVMMALDESVASCLLHTVRKHSENEEFLSMLCTLLMMVSASANGLMLPVCYLSLNTLVLPVSRPVSGTKIPDSIEFLWFSEVAAENLRKIGIIPDLLSVLRRFLHNDKICFSCCAVLWSLAVSGNSENNADQAVLESALPVTSAVLQKHLQNGVVAESACSALWALALQGCLTDSDYEPTAALLLDALRMNPERAVLVKNGCLALASLVRLSEAAALAILLDSKGSGIELIKDEYHLHSNEPGVAEALCLLMNEMVQYDEVMLNMRSQKMEKLLSEIKLQFPFSTEIQTLVDATLLKLRKEKRFV